MAVDLIYKHQQKTYELMGKSLEENGRAAYVYPTGCGKSFPALKYIEDNSEKTATIVVPSNFIKKQYEKNIKKYLENGDERLKSGSIKIVTYQEKHFSLKKHEKRVRKIKEHFRNLIRNGKNVFNKKKSLSLAKKLIPNIESDIVVFDEIHRMGAPEWERVVDQIMKENPKRKVIGMSATPERTNKRNMAYEKFGDDVVYEMSLTEALSGEKEGEVLLKSPNYIRVVSLLKAELPKYKEQIELIEDEEKRERCLRAYQKLDTIVSNSPDIQDIIAAGMQRKNGKYIVFCKDRDDMFDKIEHANEIFGKVNSKINIDYVITKKSGDEDTKGKSKTENDRTLEEFETRENGDGLNLLFCVDMLNEGVHLDGIDGEVLFDLTKSPILYKQRIGRVLSADKVAGETVIIDAANNWLAQIETYREIEMAIQSGRQREKENAEKDWDLFKLLPEELELLEILKKIGEELKYNNKFDFDEFVEWLENHNGELPRQGVIINKRKLYIEELTEEEKYEVRLRRTWYTSKDREILEKYRGKGLEEVPEEYIEKIKILRSYGLGIEEKTTYEEIVEWLETHDGEMPDSKITINGKAAVREQMTTEQINGINLMARWYRTDERRVLEEYIGKSLEEVPEEYREKIKVLREYGLGVDIYTKIIEWLENNKGKLPREHQDKTKVSEMTKERKKERELRLEWNRSEEKAILDQYFGKEIEEVPEEYREKIKVLREYGLGIEKENIEILTDYNEEEETPEITIYEQLVEWLNNNGNMPRGSITIDRVTLPRSSLTEEEKNEVLLRRRWNRSKEREILEEYIGIEIQDIPEEYREKIEKLRSYGLGIKTLTTYEQVVEWLELHDGKIPRGAITRNKKLILADERTPEESKEVNLYNNWLKCPERKILEEYIGRPIEEVPKEFREQVVVLRSYGIGVKTTSAYEQIVEWLENHNGKKPRGSISKKTVDQLTVEEKKEVQLYYDWLRKAPEKKILDQYKGRLLEEVPEEYREKVRVLRGYGLGLTKEEELKRKMQKAVGKQIAHNEETRKELEGLDKVIETEEDVEK